MELGPIREVAVLSRDVERALGFCRGAFGWETLARGASGALAGVPGAAHGRVRFVAAPADPGLPAPLPWEPGPRLLGVYSRNLEKTREAVAAAGGGAGPIVEYAIHKPMRELLASGPDDLFWTIPEAVLPLPSPALEGDPGRLHGELHSAVLVVPDVDAALGLFEGAGGMKVLFDGELGGEPFERMLGLPRGARFRIAVLAAPGLGPARLELIRFSGVPGAPARERAIGLRRLGFAVEHPAGASAALERAGARPVGPGLLVGPAGIEIELRAAQPVGTAP